MDNNRNLFITIALSVLVLVLWQIFYINPKIETERQAQLQREAIEQSQATDPTMQPAAGDVPQADATDPGVQLSTDRQSALASAGGRVAIDTPTLEGSISLRGARLDDLRLKNYHVEVDPSSPLVELLNPTGGPNAYFAEYGYTGIDGAPGATTVWSAPDGATLTPTSPVTLTYEAPNGLSFARTISVDENYMFTVEDAIANAGNDAVILQNYGRVTRFSKPATPSTFILFQGLIGVTGEEGLQEHTFDSLEDDIRIEPGRSSDGWLGVTDKYWAAVMIPRGEGDFQPRYSYFEEGAPRWQADFLGSPIALNAGQTQTVTNLLFAGAKVSNLIDGYEADLGIREFELMIDWGWLYFITKPMFHLLDWLFQVFGNFGVAILITTIIVKAIFFPLANKSYASMARMKIIQPKMEEIKQRYGEDREKLQKAMMDLYRTEKVNPVAGCWPVLIQIPVFFALYKVLFVTIEMRHAPFFGWIQDLSAADPTSLFNLFGLLPYDPSVVPVIGTFLSVGIWPIIMGITMFVQMQMNPAPPDPTQQMIFKWMPVIFTFMLATFPAGLVIYWAWNNFLSVMQQGIIMKRHGAEIALWDNMAKMFRKKERDPAD